MYAVVEYQGHQYIVTEWDNIVVDKVNWVSEWDVVSLESILCAFDSSGSSVSVWAPYVSWKVQMKVQEHTRWDKLRVMKFQSKKRYQRVKWFRAHQTVLLVESVSI